jgi:hypothetical protein
VPAWCGNWSRLFIVKSDDEFYPLNDVVLATVYERDQNASSSSAAQVFLRVAEQVQEDKRKKRAAEQDELEQQLKAKWKSFQPWIGYGDINNGSKVANHDYGD